MSSIENNIKKFLFAGLLALLFIPLLQFKMKFVKEKELKGVADKKNKTWFTKAGWFSGQYQDSTLQWFNENFGFRASAVRLRNQVYWAFDHEAKAKDVVVGKDNWLYEKNYVLAYTGKDFK